MGNETSNIKKQRLQFVKDLNHHYLRKTKLYKPRPIPNQNLQSDLTIAEVKGVNEQVNILEFLKFSHQNIAQVLDHTQGINELFGSVSSDFLIYFEYFESTLEQIIADRKQKLQRFQENEVLRIAQDVLTALSVLQFKHTHHWNIQPSTIFYNDKIKKMVLYVNELVQGQCASYRILFANPQGAPVTPEIVQSLLHANPQYYADNAHKSDIYQLGLTLLEVTSFQSANNLFSGRENGFKLDKQEIETRLGAISLHYSSNLVSLIRDMLAENPHARLSSNELLKKYFINKYPQGVDNSQLFLSFRPYIIQQPVIQQPLTSRVSLVQSQVTVIPPTQFRTQSRSPLRISQAPSQTNGNKPAFQFGSPAKKN